MFEVSNYEILEFFSKAAKENFPAWIILNDIEKVPADLFFKVQIVKKKKSLFYKKNRVNRSFLAKTWEWSK